MKVFMLLQTSISFFIFKKLQSWFNSVWIFSSRVNPIKAGGSESMYSLGGRASHAPDPKKKTLENSYRVEMHVYSPVFQGQLIEKKIRSITLLVWVLGRVEKMPLKKSKKIQKYFYLFKTNIKV